MIVLARIVAIVAAISAVVGLAAIVVDPDTSDNFSSAPERFWSNLFGEQPVEPIAKAENKDPLFAADRILVTAKLRKIVLQMHPDLSEEEAAQLAKEYVEICMPEIGVFDAEKLIFSILKGVDESHDGEVGQSDENFTGSNTNDFTSIEENIISSIEELPGPFTRCSYVVGVHAGRLNILKIKDHVENPTQTPLQHGAIRLTAGGGLFALPIVYESMQDTVGDGNNVSASDLNKIEFGDNLE